MNRTYRQMLLEGAERASYRKRPVDTLNEIEKIKQKNNGKIFQTRKV